MVHSHILVQTFPALGGLNPSLRFAKNLARIGVRVTVLVALSVQHRMEKDDILLENLRIVTFSDGYDNGFKMGSGFDYDDFMFQQKSQGSEAISEIIKTSAQEGFPVTGLVYTMLQTWAAKIARSNCIPSAALWVQPATIFNIYYFYFYGHGEAIKKIIDNPSSEVQLPGHLHLTSLDLPSFMVPSNPSSLFNQLPAFKEQLETLDSEIKPKVLVNTFDKLESNALQAMDRYNLIAIGPLVPSTYLEKKDRSQTSFSNTEREGSNISQGKQATQTTGPTPNVEWLDLKPKKSVIYIAFGSFLSLPADQMEEIALVLVESGRPFLWVIRNNENGEKLEDKLSCKEELDKLGLIVPWCDQAEMLSHPSLGCFVTHCGWNSSLESLVSGVPVVGIPQFTDQPTNAKLLQDEFKVGMRANANDKGVVERGEMKRCIDLVMECDEIRRNTEKWKNLGKGATKEGGSSYKNLKTFINDFK